MVQLSSGYGVGSLVMMLYFPLRKLAAVLLVLLLGVFFALENRAASAGLEEGDTAVSVESGEVPSQATVSDPAALVPAATVEDPTEADLPAVRSATPAAVEALPASSVGPLLVSNTDVPLAVGSQHFQELTQNSPFTRSLNLSESLILTGVARFDGKPVATLMNRETKETYVISDTPNPQGWKMVDLTPGGSLDSVIAKISVAGGEVVTVRFDENQLKPGEAKPAAGPGGDQRREGSRSGESDEDRRKRHAEIREKMEKMSEEQKNKMREIMEKKMSENPDMSREERGAAFREAMEKASKR